MFLTRHEKNYSAHINTNLIIKNLYKKIIEDFPELKIINISIRHNTLILYLGKSSTLSIRKLIKLQNSIKYYLETRFKINSFEIDIEIL